MTADLNVDKEVQLLAKEIRRLGKAGPDGRIEVKFVTLIDDETCSNTFEAIVSTLRAARKQNVVTFEGEMLLKGPHSDVPIILV